MDINDDTRHARADRRAGETKLNFDIRSYQFEDLDLEMAVSRLSQRDREILILYLMGHTHRDIARVFSISRSMISKRLRAIMDDLERQLRAGERVGKPLSSARRSR